PLNPVLGELFYGHWPDVNGRGQTNLVVEQVSHHPPITAYYICNPSKGLALQGHSAQKTSFSGGSIIGGGKEEFLITLPRLRIDGLWYGSPYIELSETSYIQSSSGWLSTGKGYFSGRSHSFKAVLTPPGSSTPAKKYEGVWHETSKDLTRARPSRTLRRLRRRVKIENEQRQRRRDEQAAGTSWQLRHFEHIPSDPVYERLAKKFNGNPPTEDTYVTPSVRSVAEY
ncbi:hypothetical protein C8T65DRAFT_640760, partial [Cerioporus squamosus]